MPARRLSVDTIAVAEIISWRYPDPGALLARGLGIEPRTTILTTTGGNSPQMLVNRLAAGIVAGRHDTVLLGGVECMYSRRRARRQEPKAWLPWSQPDDPPCPNVWGDDRPGSTQYEMAHRALAPTQVYPLLETALRHAAGRGIAEHQHAIGGLWSRFAAVAATNPHAWTPVAYSPDEIRVPSPDNRLVTFPYTKRMCANLDVDQAAAVVLTSYATATAAGIAPGPDGVPPRRCRRARPLLRDGTGVARRSRPRSGSPRTRRSTPPVTRSTTSPGSTSTPASRPPCSSRSPRSGSTGPTTAR